MNIVLISTSRADKAALDVAEAALSADGHAIKWIARSPADRMIFEQTSYALTRLKPDLAFIHGDRWDALLAAAAVTAARVPMAHIGGGDHTYGSYDDRFRDAISALADLHFPATPEAGLRLSEFARGPIIVIGELAIDWLVRAKLPSRDSTLSKFGLADYDGFVLVNWQPETAALEPNKGLELILHTLAHNLNRRTAIIFVNQNEDRGSKQAATWISDFRERVPGLKMIVGDLSKVDYAAAMKYCDCMIGNSSSGLIEAPVFGIPFVMVGGRQRGRPIGGNVLALSDTVLSGQVWDAIESRRNLGSSSFRNPYGDGTAGERLMKALREPLALR